LCRYLGNRLRLNPGAITYADLENPLKAAGVEADTLRELKNIFAACEAYRYGGYTGGPEDLPALLARAREVAGRLENIFRQVKA
jgi:hypothetical protein